jgi:hypothetical protein
MERAHDRGQEPLRERMDEESGAIEKRNPCDRADLVGRLAQAHHTWRNIQMKTSYIHAGLPE